MNYNLQMVQNTINKPYIFSLLTIESYPAVVGSNPGMGGHICACHVEVDITSWLIKAVPGTRRTWVSDSQGYFGGMSHTFSS